MIESASFGECYYPFSEFHVHIQLLKIFRRDRLQHNYTSYLKFLAYCKQMTDTTIEVIVSYKMAASFPCEIVSDKRANRFSDKERVDTTTSSAGSKAKCSGLEEFFVGKNTDEECYREFPHIKSPW